MGDLHDLRKTLHGQRLKQNEVWYLLQARGLRMQTAIKHKEFREIMFAKETASRSGYAAADLLLRN